MTIRVSPNEPHPTHHFRLSDRKGRTLGLMASDAAGNPKPLHDMDLYIKSPVTTTALKQTSGSSSYDIFDYPYSPIVQDDLSGGRGNLDFERDSTRYYDSYRTLSGRSNKAYAGPLEQYVSGLRNQVESLPGSVDFIQMTGTNRVIYRRFQATANFTSLKAWLIMRHKNTPEDLTVAIHADSAGDVGSELLNIAIPYTRMNDTLSEWLNEAMSQALTNGVYYWLVLTAGSSDSDKKHWKVAVKESVGDTYASSTFTVTPSAATYDLYFRLTDTESVSTCIPFEYKEQQYFVISGVSGAPRIFMAGDRGAADPNTGQLTKLIDATKSWTPNEHAGSVVLITDGPGRDELQPWRTIESNDGSTLTPSEPWTIEHTTATEYVILGSKIREITNHGLTNPVTDVLVSTTGVIYFCMGDSVAIRALRAFNDGGTWKDFGHADCKRNEGNAKSKAVFMVYKPQAQKIVIANNSDATSDVSVNTSTNADIPAWGTDLTWGANAVKVDSKYRRINGLVVYPDISGAEGVWIFKTDMPFIYPASGNPYPVSIDEMRTVRSSFNGVRPLRHGVYVYFPLLQGLQRYYGGNFEDIGPNLGEGLPENRRGPIVWMQGYPGKYFIAVDAGDDGYSSILDSGGWHERYRAPKGQRIKALAFQVVPGSTLDRLWVYQGNDLLYLPFPSDSTNELEDENYPFTFEFAVELSRMHAGIFDVQKMVKTLKMQTENLEVDENAKKICWFEVDYKVNDDEAWTTIDDPFTISPTQEVDFTKIYGVAGRRLRWRIRGYTRDQTKTPVFLAVIIFAVLRVDIKNFYGPLHFVLEDNQKVIGLREEFREASAAEQLELLESWGDATNDSLLRMYSVASMCNEKMIFLNLGPRRQIGFKHISGNEHTSDKYVVQLTFQEA